MRHLFPLSVLLLVACPATPTDDSDKDGVTPTNNVPVADAGASVTQSADSAVVLNGAGSSDADGDELTYKWSFDRVPEGSTLPTKEKPFSANNSADASQPSFTPDREGTYIIELMVNDGKVNSAPDYVIVNITAAENLPVANAGVDLTAAEGTLVTLDGSKSYDSTGKALTYAWTLVDKPSASSLSTLSGADTAAASFTPDARGNYTVNLVVSNGLASSVADAAVVTVTGEDGAPIANAGEDQSGEDCTTITLDCTGSTDPDGDTLAYSWELQSKPTGSTLTSSSFSSRSSATPTLYPDVAGTYVASCAVYDGKTWSTPDMVTIDASERRSNSKPVVDAGADTSVSGGTAECTESGYTYNCDECSSTTINLGADGAVTDPDGDPLVMTWTVTDGSATVADPTVLSTTAVLSDAEPTEPDECEDVEYRFELSVTDCTGETTTDVVKYTLSCCGVADTAP